MIAALGAAAGAAVSATPAVSATTTARAATPNCGSAPVTLNGYFETGFPLPTDLTKAFTKQFPNVKFKIREDQFAVITANAPRVLNSGNAPDLIRVPTISDLVKDKLLKNLDPYAKAFGWNKWPASELSQNRLTPDGKSRGAGSLFAFGLNYSMTGVFYDKKLAAQIGMTTPPATVAELDADMAKAKTAGILPIEQFNKGTAGLVFPLQDLMGAYGPPGPIASWIFQKPGATIDTPSNETAATHLQQWIQAGYFSSDANAVDYATMMSRFIAGQGLFMFNGDWESGNLGKQMGSNVGFFLMPPAAAGGKHVAMSAPLTYGIGAKAKHPDCAAFFANWVATNKVARKIDVEIGGSNPGGPTNLSIPKVPIPLISQTLAAGNVINKENGATDFIANATGGIFASALTPQVQEMVGGQQTGVGMLKAVQAEYQKELAG